MKAHEFFISKHDQSAIKIENDQLTAFYSLFHFHDEVQVTFIKKGRGILFAGAGLVSFNPGDVFILGSKLPHVFKSSENVKNVHGISIYFNPQFGSDQFWNLEETKRIRSLVEESIQGIKLTDSYTLKIVSNLIIDLLNSSAEERLIDLLKILNYSSKANKQIISNVEFSKPPNLLHSNRMDKVISFISDHYNRQITLDEIAAEAHMTPNAFCRYFKKRTRQTFTKYINSVRVSNAIRMLIDTDYPISEVSFLCGFKNLSNFNRQFLSISGKRPGEVRALNQ